MTFLSTYLLVSQFIYPFQMHLIDYLPPPIMVPPYGRVAVLARAPNAYIIWVNSILYKSTGIWLYIISLSLTLCQEQLAQSGERRLTNPVIWVWFSLTVIGWDLFWAHDNSTLTLDFFCSKNIDHAIYWTKSGLCIISIEWKGT